MNTNPFYGDLCPLCRRPLTLVPDVIARSSNMPYPTRIDYLPHCTTCANDLPNRQRWNDLMNDRSSP
nr:hypothetical protein [Streptomyces violaceoruber]